MPQTIEATVQLSLPKDKVLIKKVEYDQLKLERDKNEIWDIKDLRRYLQNRQRTWVNEHLLANYALRDGLDQLRKDGSLWGGGPGSTWGMFADEMKKFIHDNREIIFKGE